jgi:hypothetical protein
VVTGVTHKADAVALNAKADLLTAINDAKSRYRNAVVITGDLAGRTLKQGLYHSAAAMAIGGSTAHLTLDAENNANAVFIFQMVRPQP